jgi:hypothetical protein
MVRYVDDLLLIDAKDDEEIRLKLTSRDRELTIPVALLVRVRTRQLTSIQFAKHMICVYCESPIFGRACKT